MPDLSILIPARNEMFLAKTVENVFANARRDTEVIVVLDGEWPDPQLPGHPKLRVTHSDTVIGQRAATNLAARMSTAAYVMKLDAHCGVEEGFDAKLIAADEELGRPDVTQIPAMYNLHAFNWRCKACGRETYQGPTPTTCEGAETELDTCPPPCGASAGFERVLVWHPRHKRAAGNGSAGRRGLVRSEFWRFDQQLHFQYWHGYDDRPAAKSDLADVMSSVGASFFMRRKRFEEIGGLDEAHGSWGQYGTEIACKSWLSGGRHIVNKRTWFSHLFRTQGGDFGFPYPMRTADQEKARAHSRKLWLEGTWAGAKYPLSWLVEKFAPVPDWPAPREIMSSDLRAALVESDRVLHHQTAIALDDVKRREEAAIVGQSKGLVYYTDNCVDPVIGQAVRDQLQRAAPGLRISSVSRGPYAHFSEPIWREWGVQFARGYLTMFKQILMGLEAVDTDIAFLVEHDVLYHQSHFDFTPPRDDTFYYNQNVWKVDAESGRALHYRCSQTSGCCASRALLVEHYKKRVAAVEANAERLRAAGLEVKHQGYDRNLGFEPGTNKASREIDPHGAEVWMSPLPNVDIRHAKNLTPSRWSPDQFRNKSTCQGWTEADAVPGWGVTKGRFAAFLEDVAKGELVGNGRSA